MITTPPEALLFLGLLLVTFIFGFVLGVAWATRDEEEE